ncbi:MAG TPA: septum formation initiator family protein [Candidatus Faecenecus gallistercoris]|uniref:Septum formation initiator family protein n=1 Tax=Candidatus Faecenecus gallistercoris TaxID=2840793 RepID=A0A9D1CLK9_9FIRM|nr:septum formation initiator family protein [Bacillota bacterium]MDY4051417.1 septum formation initiator family protein [Candidatus Faecenecus gallistercoris]CDE08938.1 septum formation initiator [Bacillus sp. CAG:988]MDD7101850.1 septum formation initiator family protein [Bacillota bacterium]PWL72603.1 MAG: septum formation initiator family protein [Bacillota bacterium]
MRQPKNKHIVKTKRRLVLFGITCCAVIIGLTIMLGKTWVEIYQKYQQKDSLTAKLEELQKEEEELKADVERLQDPDYVARYAREKYLYSKDGEFIIKLP